jgi:PPOX class probable F420-dependent enzyme
MSESQPVGHGQKQRDIIRMSPEEVDAYLNERRSMTMSTINPDGSIHSIAMWYGFVDGAIGFETKAKSQKVLNLRRNPNITCLVEDGDYYEELRGVSLVGTAEIIDDPEQLFELGKSVFSRYMVPYTEEMRGAVEMITASSGSRPRGRRAERPASRATGEPSDR